MANLLMHSQNAYRLAQCGRTTFDLWAILQQHDNSRATSNKMMYNKRFTRFQIEKGKQVGSVSLKILHNSVAIRNPSSKCAKLHTVAASNNRDHVP